MSVPFERRSITSVALLMALLCGSATADADETRYELWLYGWLTSLDGKAGVGPLDVNVDASIGDVLDALDLAYMFGLRAERGPWVWTVDVVTANLENDFGRNATLRVEEQIFRVTGGIRLENGVELFGGARAVDLDTRLATTLPVVGAVAAEDGDSWVDPIVGVGYRKDLTNRWQLGLSGDIGGFGVGSDFSWSTQGWLRFRASELFSVTAGYRVLDIDYEDGNGAGRFAYDVTSAGPMVAVAWQF